MGWYITILQEMRDQLGLKGNELIVFAFINGYSQGGHGCYHGSLATLQGVCGIASRQTATDVLKSLVEKGYIYKSETIKNGVKYVSYAVCPNIGQGVQKMDKGCLKNGHNIEDININNTLSIKRAAAIFKNPLLMRSESIARKEETRLIRRNSSTSMSPRVGLLESLQ